MTEVCNCGVGHLTRLRETCVSFGVPPSHVYKGGEEEEAGQGGRAPWGIQLGFRILVGVPFLPREGERGKEEEGRRKEGAPPPSLVQFGLAMGRGRALPCGPSLLSTKAHEGP